MENKKYNKSYQLIYNDKEGSYTVREFNKDKKSFKDRTGFSTINKALEATWVMEVIS